MKNEYIFDKGTHYSRGKKDQPAYLSIGMILLGAVLQCFHGLSMWYSAVLFVAGLVTYWVNYKKMKYTYMKVVFDQSCLYTIEGPDRFDINKVFGIGFGDHSRYSARFGWDCAPSGDAIELFAYVHNDGQVESKKMLSCLPNDPVELCLKITDDAYEFSASKRSDGQRAVAKLPRKSNWLYSLLAYRLFPYFGGNVTAPHEMRLEMVQLH